MDKAIVKGIIYSIFDEKIGPDARAWLPASLPAPLRDSVSARTINLAFREQVPESLSLLPFPADGMKALVKYMAFPSKTRRGGIGECTLSLMFDEKDDTIFYKYLDQFEKVFDDHAPAFVARQQDEPGPATLLPLVEAVLADVRALVDDLRKRETQPVTPAGAFPDAAAPDSLRKFKVIVCGDPDVGKTSLVLQFTDKAFSRVHIPTIGVNVSEKQVVYKDVAFKFVIWDIAGHAKFLAIRKHFYEGAMGKLLVFDLTRADTLASIEKWNEDVAKYLGPGLVGIVIGNKNDLVDDRAVDREPASQVATTMGLEYIETSAKTGEHVDEAFGRIAGYLYDRFIKS